ncbi:MAG: Asp-tRNA(Asn)/Glu-tRNA(Gln) amidotransferase subunit GatB, partial [Verrucomicrobiota bacterium]
MKAGENSRYEVCIGLEVHVQLRTRSKMFCGCSTDHDAPPNTNVCPVCLGYPGSLPVINSEAIKLTVLSGLMLGSRINMRSKFDRKSYFYPDMPKNYQISQYDMPFCDGGSVAIGSDGDRRISIKRIHLEEDVAKSVHSGGYSGVDFNRAGIPLMEIVSEPDIDSPDTAFAYLQSLKEILMYGEVSDCNLEQGNIRCDVNCSIRPFGTKTLGVKTEIKNLNTFRGVHDSLVYEVGRQIETLDGGGTINQETRRWDADAGMTFLMRSKEYAHDYRYFPDPDLPPVCLAQTDVDQWAEEVPELPRQRRKRIIADYGLPEYDAGVLVADRAMADFFERAALLCDNSKAVSNWVMTEMSRMLSESGKDIQELPLEPGGLAELVKLVDNKAVSFTGAKKVFEEMFNRGGSPADLVE